MQPSSPRLTTAVLMPPAEKALLTYQAINQSDDVVLLLESADNTPTAEALIVGANDAFRHASRYSNDQLLGRKATDLFLSANEVNGLRDAIRNVRSFRTELACSRADVPLSCSGCI